MSSKTKDFRPKFALAAQLQLGSCTTWFESRSSKNSWRNSTLGSASRLKIDTRLRKPGHKRDPCIAMYSAMYSYREDRDLIGQLFEVQTPAALGDQGDQIGSRPCDPSAPTHPESGITTSPTRRTLGCKVLFTPGMPFLVPKI